MREPKTKGRISLYNRGRRYLHRLAREIELSTHASCSNARGVATEQRSVKVIVSMTTIPDRLAKIHLVLESLFTQSVKPDAILLWISEKIDPAIIPQRIHQLKGRGLDLRFCEDIGPHTKYFYTLQENPRHILVTADDDVLYPRNWLSELYEAYRLSPHCIHCHRAHEMTRNDAGQVAGYDEWNYMGQGVTGPSKALFPTGAGGVLFPPGVLHQDVFNKTLIEKLSPDNDDIWLKAMSLLMGTDCQKIHKYNQEVWNVRGSQQRALYKKNVLQNKNDEQLQAVFDHYHLHQAF